MLVLTMKKNPAVFLNQQSEFNSHFTLTSNGFFCCIFSSLDFATVRDMLLCPAEGFQLLTGLLHASLKKKKKRFRKELFIPLHCRVFFFL